VGVVIASVVIVLIVLAPTLLFGQSLGAFGLVLMGAIILGVGLLTRRGGEVRVRALGTIIVIVGGVVLVLALGLTALLLAGARGY
jgi:hypothetical protein